MQLLMFWCFSSFFFSQYQNINLNEWQQKCFIFKLENFKLLLTANMINLYSAAYDDDELYLQPHSWCWQLWRNCLVLSFCPSIYHHQNSVVVIFTQNKRSSRQMLFSALYFCDASAKASWFSASTLTELQQLVVCKIMLTVC